MPVSIFTIRNVDVFLPTRLLMQFQQFGFDLLPKLSKNCLRTPKCCNGRNETRLLKHIQDVSGARATIAVVHERNSKNLKISLPFSEKFSADEFWTPIFCPSLHINTVLLHSSIYSITTSQARLIQNNKMSATSFTQSKFFKLWTTSPMAKAAYPLAVVIGVPLTYCLFVSFHTLSGNNDLQ